MLTVLFSLTYSVYSGNIFSSVRFSATLHVFTSSVPSSLQKNQLLDLPLASACEITRNDVDVASNFPVSVRMFPRISPF